MLVQFQMPFPQNMISKTALLQFSWPFIHILFFINLSFSISTPINNEIAKDIFPFLRVYKNGTIERYAGTNITKPGLDSQTSVVSKDISISFTQFYHKKITLSARIYRPHSVTGAKKLPVLVYYHGGAFIIGSPAEPSYHHCMNEFVSQANVILISVGYRLAPEYPLPIAYEDSWSALKWVINGGHSEPWLQKYADFERVFLAGDSAGANIVHNLGLRVKGSDLDPNKKLIKGIAMIDPYFWGKKRVGKEMNNAFGISMVDNWWLFVSPSDKGTDDPYINPFADGAPSLKDIGSDKVIVFVAEKDILCDRGKLYYKNLVKSGWKGKAELVETKGEDHVFHLNHPDTKDAHEFIKKWASYYH